MYKVKLMNKISSVGLDYFNEDYDGLEIVFAYSVRY